MEQTSQPHEPTNEQEMLLDSKPEPRPVVRDALGQIAYEARELNIERFKTQVHNMANNIDRARQKREQGNEG